MSKQATVKTWPIPAQDVWISAKTLGTMLDLKDVRSAHKWAKDNNVGTCQILSELRYNLLDVKKSIEKSTLKTAA